MLALEESIKLITQQRIKIACLYLFCFQKRCFQGHGIFRKETLSFLVEIKATYVIAKVTY